MQSNGGFWCGALLYIAPSLSSVMLQQKEPHGNVLHTGYRDLSSKVSKDYTVLNNANNCFACVELGTEQTQAHTYIHIYTTHA